MRVLYRPKYVSAFRFPIELGIVPEILVLYRPKYVSAFRFPIELGISPRRHAVAPLHATRRCILHLALGGWVLHAGLWDAAFSPQHVTWHLSREVGLR